MSDNAKCHEKNKAKKNYKTILSEVKREKPF
jgi:hypothetical protein